MNLLFAKTTDSEEPKMDLHKNARLTLHCRALLADLVIPGQPVSQIALLLGITSKTGRKWLERFRA
jgi:hypothetical protein